MLIHDLCSDSRLVKPGDAFFALPGDTQDGQCYIEEAVEKGAVVIFQQAAYKLPVASCELRAENGQQVASVEHIDGTQYDHQTINHPHMQRISSPSPRVANIPIISLPNLQDTLGFMASRFFDDPSHTLPVIGVTGTNGKTSCTHWIAQLLSQDRPCGVMGTLGVGFLGHLEPLQHTTPDAISVQRYFSRFLAQHARAVALEVSSHALMQGRVRGTHFDTVVFTNLSQDHLDYHGDLEHYGRAKRRLWTEYAWRYAVVNIEDAFGRQLVNDMHDIDDIQTLPKTHKNHRYCVTYGIACAADVCAHNVVLTEQGVTAEITSPWGDGRLHSPLLGRFNLSNVLAALAVACLHGVPFKEALTKIRTLQPVPGRLQRVVLSSSSLAPNKQQDLALAARSLQVFVDYAHTPDALMKTLTALRLQCLGALWCVFGCGGERDHGKRPLMARIAEEYSDHVVITQDNSRGEDPKTIFSDMVRGMQSPEKATLELDRGKAITWAIQTAAPQDIVLIAGKGHETYQLLGKERLYFSDYEMAKEALAQW